MIANFSHTKKPSILDSIDFGSVVSVVSNRPPGGGGYSINTGQRDYPKGIFPQQQFDLVKNEIGGNCVRIGTTTTIDGNADKAGYGNFDLLLKESLTICKNMGIKVILLLDHRLSSYMNTTEINGNFEWEDNTRDCQWTADQLNTDDGRSAANGGVVMGTLERCETQHYSMVQAFINRYSSYWDPANTILELGNEPELFMNIWKTGGGNGTSLDHFWPQKTQISIRGFKGMYEGAQALMPTLRVSTPANSGWCPVALYDEYLPVMPNAIVSYHWYSNQEMNMDRGQWPSSAGGTAGNQFRNIFDWLNLKWGRQVIITECNGRNDSDQAGFLNQDYQIGFFSSFLPKAVASPICERVTAYTLLSDPYRTGDEGTFGLYWFPNIDKDNPDHNLVDFQGTLTAKKAVSYLKYMTSPQP